MVPRSARNARRALAFLFMTVVALGWADETLPPVQSATFDLGLVNLGELSGGYRWPLHLERVALDIRYRFWTLLGEPVYAIAVRWVDSYATDGVPEIRFNTQAFLPEIARYPDLEARLRDLRPLSLELAAEIVPVSRNRGGRGLEEVSLIVDLPPRMGVWEANLTPTSPDWEAWPLGETLAFSRADRARLLMDMFRGQATGDWIEIASLELRAATWPLAAIEGVEREYRRREEDRERARTASSDDFWSTGGPGAVTSTGPLSVPEVDAPDAAVASRVAAWQTKAASLGEARDVIRLTPESSGDVVVTAPALLEEITYTVTSGSGTTVLRPDGTGSVRIRKPETTDILTVSNHGFVLGSVPLSFESRKVSRSAQATGSGDQRQAILGGADLGGLDVATATVTLVYDAYTFADRFTVLVDGTPAAASPMAGGKGTLVVETRSNDITVAVESSRGSESGWEWSASIDLKLVEWRSAP